MLKINTKSIIFKTAVIYIFITLFNISIFDLMVYENQIDLIFQNSVLASKNKASTLKYQIDDIINTTGTLDDPTINRVLSAASSLNIKDVTFFNEGGGVFVSVKNNQVFTRDKADMRELKLINMAITKQGFEDKLFYHDVNRKTRIINLYTPFTYEQDKIGVVAITLGMADLDRQMRLLFMQCLIIALLVTVLHVAFAVLFAKMLLMPLRKLTEATKQIAAGDLEIRVPIVRDDEIGGLASSFNEMSVALSRMRDEAKGANPLTGLPGNITIATQIDEGLDQGRMLCVLYCDLDNFKAYNDKYGFTKGDEAILYTRDCLLSTAQKKGMMNVFVGHEGGDDFVVICDYDVWENYAKTFITTFDRGIYQFYNSVDARNGFIESVNRRGERQRFPLMSISIAVVTNKTRPFRRHAEMIQIAAEVKKYVKSIDGSCYAIDRRQGPIGQPGGGAITPGQMQTGGPQIPSAGQPTVGVAQQEPGTQQMPSQQRQPGPGMQQMPPPQQQQQRQPGPGMQQMPPPQQQQMRQPGPGVQQMPPPQQQQQRQPGPGVQQMPPQQQQQMRQPGPGVQQPPQQQQPRQPGPGVQQPQQQQQQRPPQQQGSVDPHQPPPPQQRRT